MGKVNTDILTYEPYWYECGNCDYHSANYELLSELMFEVNRHRKESHVKQHAGYPAPIKPSQVGLGLTNK